MAKALFGHVGVGPDLRLTAEVHRLRARVSQLEAELVEVRAENTALADAVAVHDGMLAISVPDSVADAEPALA